MLSILGAVGSVEERHEGDYAVHVAAEPAFLGRPRGKDLDVEQVLEADPVRDLRDRRRGFARRHPRWGYRRAHAVLGREVHVVNRMEIQR